MEFSGRCNNQIERNIIMSIEHKDGVVALRIDLGFKVITERIITIKITLSFLIFNNKLN